MKQIIKTIFFNTIAIAAVSYLTPGLSYSHNLNTLIIAAVVLSFVNSFIKPFLKILFLPINVITLGLFGWFINVIVLFLVTLLVPGLNISGFEADIFGTTFVFSRFWAFIVISFMLNLVTTGITWILG